MTELIKLVPGAVWIILVVILVAFAIGRMWKKLPQDVAGIVTGLNKRVINGGGGLVIPVLERIDIISLGAISLSVSIEDSRSSQQVPIDVDSTVVVKVKNQRDSILSAGELFTGKDEKQVKQSITEILINVMEGKLREVVSSMTVEQLYNDREQFSSTVQGAVATELETMGLEIVSFTIKDISDKNGYINSLGVKQIVERAKDAEIAKAEAQREQTLKTSVAKQEAAKASAEADARISEANKEKVLKQEQYRTEQETAKAKADASYQIQKNITQQEVINSEMQNQLLIQERQKDIEAAQIQIQITKEMKNKELAEKRAETAKESLKATILEPALADKQKAETEAEANKYKQIAKAQADAEQQRVSANAKAEAVKVEANAAAESRKVSGLAEAESTKAVKLAEAEVAKAALIAEAEGLRAKGLAEAENIKAKLLAEAEGIKAKGIAEAEAMEKKAEAYSKYNNAAVLEMIVNILPDMAKNIAEPLSKIDKITIIDGGQGDGGNGVGNLSQNVGAVMAKTFETLRETTGIDMKGIVDAEIAGKTTRNINLTGDSDVVKEVAEAIEATKAFDKEKNQNKVK